MIKRFVKGLIELCFGDLRTHKINQVKETLEASFSRSCFYVYTGSGERDQEELEREREERRRAYKEWIENVRQWERLVY